MATNISTDKLKNLKKNINKKEIKNKNKMKSMIKVMKASRLMNG